jgi:dUTP pyrophosphatase
MEEIAGKLIVLYGINNLGKSTQVKLLVERLKANGYKAEYLKYPIYDLNPSGVILNDYLRNGNPYELSSKEAQIIYAMNRTQYQTELINKLESGINVIAEDYKGTGIAWGLGAGVDENFLKKINSHLVPEDLVFLFDGDRFRQAIENNHKHENNEDLMTKVRWAHLKLREEYGWLKINANDTIENIHEELWARISELLNGKQITEEIILNNTKPKNNYSYTGFKAVGDIINNNQAKSFPTAQTATPNTNPENKISEQKESIEVKVNETKTISQSVLDNKLIVERLGKDVKLPTKAHSTDAGYDLYSNDYYSITPYGQAIVGTGIKMAIPTGYVGLIWDKSGIASNGIKTMGGVIDENYRGEVKVVIKNLSETDFHIIPGQKIAQILIQKVDNFEISEENITDRTERQENGFGSSGKF